MLFIPGAFVGAWMWEETFLPWFADHGFDSYAMDFRARSRRGWQLHRLGLADFVADVAEVVADLPGTPVLVGHSLGGLVAWEFARRRPAAALVMFSSVPPDGSLRSWLTMAGDDPVSAVKMAAMSLLPAARFLGTPPAGVYSSRVPPDVARGFTRRLRGESWRVLSEALLRPGAATGGTGVPTYVVGATGDHLIPASEVRRTARMLDAPCKVFDGFSHSPFVEPGWEKIAADIARWIDGALGGASARPAGRARSGRATA